MGRTESIFAAILLAAVVSAVLFVVLRNGGTGPANPSPQASASQAANGLYAVRLTGDPQTDTCTCYEQAFAFASRNTSDSNVTSDLYRGGYQTCSSRLGSDGANAWSNGWNNGASRNNSLRSCRSFLARR